MSLYIFPLGLISVKFIFFYIPEIIHAVDIVNIGSSTQFKLFQKLQNFLVCDEIKINLHAKQLTVDNMLIMMLLVYKQQVDGQSSTSAGMTLKEFVDCNVIWYLIFWMKKKHLTQEGLPTISLSLRMICFDFRY